MKYARTIFICAGLAVLYALPLFTLPGFSAAYIKFDGVDGEALGEDQDDGTGGTATRHKDEIDVLAWSWGTSQSGSFSTGGGSGQGGRECIQDVSFTKYIDKASPKLMLHCLDGKIFSNVVLAITEPDGSTNQDGTPTGKTYDYFTVTMVDAVVSAVAGVAEEASPNRPVESFSLNFAKIEMKYIPTDPATGTPDYANPVELKWDLDANQKY